MTIISNGQVPKHSHGVHASNGLLYMPGDGVALTNNPALIHNGRDAIATQDLSIQPPGRVEDQVPR